MWLTRYLHGASHAGVGQELARLAGLSKRSEQSRLPVFPLRNAVLYPFVMAPFSAGRPASIAALEAALSRDDKQIAVFGQRDAETQDPGVGDLYPIGCRAMIRRMMRTEDSIEVILQGMERIRLTGVKHAEGWLEAEFESAPVNGKASAETEALQRELVALAAGIQATMGVMPGFDLRDLLSQIEEPVQLVYLLASFVGLDAEHGQALLETEALQEAMGLLHQDLLHEREVAQLQRKIAGRAESQMGRQQREYMLRQQLEAIQKELGEQNPERGEAEELRERLDALALPQAARAEADRELTRLEQIPSASPEHQVVRTHLDLILELPWNQRSEDNLNLARARRVLDEDHYDLRDIKDRILEHLAVLRLNPEAQAPILCFVGPPGVGKTSLGQSIARALGRSFEHFSLGGLHDEAELRGHRRTYIGAMPGRIIEALRRAGSMNPLLMLDEIDKLGRDFRGDPASALLEILDPAQNNAFRDNYLDLPFDLSRVFFITTANTTDSIPAPLLDRMETLRLAGYTDEEKLEIARRYLIQRRREQAGLTEAQLSLPDPTLLAIIHHWTREAGVRELEREIGRIARKRALVIAETEPVSTGERPAPVTAAEITVAELPDLLGPERFSEEQARQILPPGVAAGLAWTPSGGDVIYVEAIRLPSGGELTLTGQLGDIMKESARAARNWVLSQRERLGIQNPDPGIHIHVPAGAIPKDGPSAGITIATAVASLYTGRAVRSDTAMTGEITLTGLVLPVGGIKEKLLAARRAGFSRVILPERNRAEVERLESPVIRELELHFAGNIDEVLEASLASPDGTGSDGG